MYQESRWTDRLASLAVYRQFQLMNLQKEVGSDLHITSEVFSFIIAFNIL